MNRLLTLAHKIYRLRFHIKWYSQYKQTIREKLYYHSVDSLPKDVIDKVLILAPHADDEWIGASTVIRNSGTVDVLYMEYYGDNYDESNIITRQMEIKSSSNENNFNLISANRDERKESIRKVLNNSYSAIFIPSYIDWHPEHRHTFQLFSEVYLEIRRSVSSYVFMYNISVPHNNSARHLMMMPMNRREQSYKWRMFNKIYKSQDMHVYRFKLQECLNSYETKAHSAELFQKMSESSMRRGLQILSDAVEIKRLDLLKRDINDIYSIRKAVSD